MPGSGLTNFNLLSYSTMRPKPSSSVPSAPWATPCLRNGRRAMQMAMTMLVCGGSSADPDTHRELTEGQTAWPDGALDSDHGNQGERIGCTGTGHHMPSFSTLACGKIHVGDQNNEAVRITAGKVHRIRWMNEALGTNFVCTRRGSSSRSGFQYDNILASMSTDCEDFAKLNEAAGTTFDCRSMGGGINYDGVTVTTSCDVQDLLLVLEWATPIIEHETYADYYFGASIATAVIALMSLVLSSATENTRALRNLKLSGIIGIRLLDMLSDWAFMGNSLNRSSYFVLAYTAQGGDPAAVYISAFAFCIVGTLAWLVDFFWGSYLHVQQDQQDGNEDLAAAVRCLAVFVFVLEDFPQLVLQGIYVSVVGFEGTDPYAYIAIVTTSLSCVIHWFYVCCASQSCSKLCSPNFNGCCAKLAGCLGWCRRLSGESAPEPGVGNDGIVKINESHFC